MKVSNKCVALVAEFEGFRSDAYLCPAKVPTLGYGFTKGVKIGDKITREEADTRLLRELDEFANGVRKIVKVSVTQCQFDALVSFAFNVGVTDLKESTLLKMLNAGDSQGAANQFLRWNKAGGKVLPGLTRRRQAEKDLFLSC